LRVFAQEVHKRPGTCAGVTVCRWLAIEQKFARTEIRETPLRETMAAAAAEARPLGIGQINAVHKEPVPDKVAADFTVGDELPEGLTPRLVDVGGPANLDMFVVDDVLSSAECDSLIHAAESARLTFWDSTADEPRRDYRNADTVEVPNVGVAEALWRRVARHVPPTLHVSELTDPARSQPDLDGTWAAHGTNQKLLIARYLSGGHFSPHTDGYSVVDFNDRSMYTMLLYLNDCSDGGGTKFYRSEQLGKLEKDEAGRFTGQAEHEICTVAARKGRACFFFHNIVHEGVAPAGEQVKYIIRSDLMVS
jgi:hypothetical protein